MTLKDERYCTINEQQPTKYDLIFIRIVALYLPELCLRHDNKSLPIKPNQHPGVSRGKTNDKLQINNVLLLHIKEPLNNYDHLMQM